MRTERLPCLLLLFTISACSARQSTLPSTPSGGSTPNQSADPRGGASSTDNTSAVGEAQVLLGSGALGLTYFPDEGTSLIRSSPDVAIVLSAGTSTFLVEGPDLTHLTRASEVLRPGEAHSFDNGYAGISAVVSLAGTLYGFYHAEDHEELPALPGGIPGFYASVGLATSSDSGKTWQKRGQVLVSSQPKSFEAYPGQGDRGAGEPGAVASADGRYLYLYYSEHSRLAGRGVDVCVARADLSQGAPLPGAFRKYRNGDFSEPALGGQDSPIVRGPASDVNALEAHVTYSAALAKYVMVLGYDAYNERMAGAPPARSGIYYALSDDALHFSEPRRLVVDQGVPQTARSVSWEASLLWDDASGRAGWLVYGFSPSWGTTPHYLVGRRLEDALKL